MALPYGFETHVYGLCMVMVTTLQILCMYAILYLVKPSMNKNGRRDSVHLSMTTSHRKSGTPWVNYMLIHLSIKRIIETKSRTTRSINRSRRVRKGFGCTLQKQFQCAVSKKINERYIQTVDKHVYISMFFLWVSKLKYRAFVQTQYIRSSDNWSDGNGGIIFGCNSLAQIMFSQLLPVMLGGCVN